MSRRTALVSCFVLVASACFLRHTGAPSRQPIIVNGWVLLPEDLEGLRPHAI